MKHILIIILTLLGVLNVNASDRQHISVLNEISYQQAQNHPYPWTISRYTYEDQYGNSTSRYFVFAPNIQHESRIVITKAKRLPYPWTVEINNRTYYADFDDNDEIHVGDTGILKYDGDRLYFYPD